MKSVKLKHSLQYHRIPYLVLCDLAIFIFDSLVEEQSKNVRVLVNNCRLMTISWLTNSNSANGFTMRVSNIKRIVKLLLLPVLILYAFLNILVEFRRYINGNEFVKQNGDSFEISESVIFDNNKVNTTKTSIKTITSPEVLSEHKKENGIINWKKVVQLKDELSPHDTINYYQKYTYSNPKTYKGTFFEAWPPSKSRSIVPYMNENFTVVPHAHKISNKTLIVIVQSIPPDFNYRNIWRKTWGKYSNKKTSVLFLLGKSLNISKDKEAKLVEEQNRFGDIIRIDGLIEHYHNLTFKSLFTLKFFLDRNIFNSKNPPKYLLKADTDNIVNLPRLYNQLTAGRYKNIDNLLLGSCFCCGGQSDKHCPRIRPLEKPVPWKTIKITHKGNKIRRKIIHFMMAPENHPYSKWAIPDYLFNGTNFPSYLNGNGYLMSREAAECIYDTALRTPFFPMEDVYITGLVAQECNINRLNHIGFHAERLRFNYEGDIINHRNCGHKEISSHKNGTQKCHDELRFFASKYDKFFRNEMLAVKT